MKLCDAMNRLALSSIIKCIITIFLEYSVKNIMEKSGEFHLLTMVFTGNPLIYITTLERYS